MTFIPDTTLHHTPQHLFNRVEAVMSHIPRYSFSGRSRLAADIGVSRSTISRLLNGRSRPSYPLVLSITRALEKHLGKSLDTRDIFSFDVNFSIQNVCELCGCEGCLPDAVYHADGTVKPEFRHLKPGRWSGMEEGLFGKRDSTL